MSDTRARFRPRVSLLSVLLLTAVVALAIALGREHQRLHPLREEVGRLREEIGVVTVTDVNKGYVAPLGDVYDPTLHFRWRAYVPPGRTARLTAQMNGSRFMLTLAPGETSFDLRFFPDLEANRQSVRFRTIPDRHGGGALGSISGIPPWLGPYADECVSIVDHDAQFGVQPGSKLTLLDRRGKSADGSPTAVLVTFELQ